MKVTVVVPCPSRRRNRHRSTRDPAEQQGVRPPHRLRLEDRHFPVEVWRSTAGPRRHLPAKIRSPAAERARALDADTTAAATSDPPNHRHLCSSTRQATHGLADATPRPGRPVRSARHPTTAPPALRPTAPRPTDDAISAVPDLPPNDVHGTSSCKRPHHGERSSKLLTHQRQTPTRTVPTPPSAPTADLRQHDCHLMCDMPRPADSPDGPSHVRFCRVGGVRAPATGRGGRAHRLTGACQRSVVNRASVAAPVAKDSRQVQVWPYES